MNPSTCKRMPRRDSDGASLPPPPAPGYRGRRTAEGSEVLRFDAHGLRIALPGRSDLYSPPQSGFDWGSDGPGSDHLALAILADAIDGHEALRLHQDYARLVVSRLDQAGWDLGREQVRRWVRDQQGLEE